MKKYLWSLFGVGALLVGGQVAHSALTDSQQYTVSVAKNVSLTAPAADPLTGTNALTKTYTVADLDAAALVADDTYVFPTQTWHAKGNVKNGVSVRFDMAAFVNQSDTTIGQDGSLSVTVASTNGPATWTRTSATSTAATNFGNTTSSTDPLTGIVTTTPDPLGARVSYSSNRVGQADFSVGVSFLASDINAVAAGDYVTVVYGTLTEN